MEDRPAWQKMVLYLVWVIFWYSVNYTPNQDTSWNSFDFSYVDQWSCFWQRFDSARQCQPDAGWMMTKLMMKIRVVVMTILLMMMTVMMVMIIMRSDDFGNEVMYQMRWVVKYEQSNISNQIYIRRVGQSTFARLANKRWITKIGWPPHQSIK